MDVFANHRAYWKTGISVILMLAARDRKSTRLNSSHRCISYAVFCLKKKTIMRRHITPPSLLNVFQTFSQHTTSNFPLLYLSVTLQNFANSRHALLCAL